MAPAAVVHVILPVVVAEDELVDGLRPVHDPVDQRFAQRIAERPGRGVGHGDPDAAHLLLAVNVVAREEEVIAAVGMQDRRRPHGLLHPADGVRREDPGVLLPMHEVLRRKGVEERLFLVKRRIGGINPVFIAENHPFGIGVPSFEKRIAAFFARFRHRLRTDSRAGQQAGCQ